VVQAASAPTNDDGSMKLARSSLKKNPNTLKQEDQFT
jgi:hypothetical protein